jgi:hypothetical protein
VGQPILAAAGFQPAVFVLYYRGAGQKPAVVTPAELAEAPRQDREIVMLLNFFHELRRKVPMGK